MTGCRWLVVSVLGSFALLLAGCLMAGIEGAKAVALAFEGNYVEREPLSARALARYRGFKVGTLRAAGLEELEPLAGSVEYDTEMAEKVLGRLPDRLEVFMKDDAQLTYYGRPAMVVNMENVKVIKRTGVGGLALPKVEVWATVSLVDAASGEELGQAEVAGTTGSRVAANEMQLASILSRGTAKWINESKLGK